MNIYEVVIKATTIGYYKNLETARKVIEKHYGSFINSKNLMYTEQEIAGYYGYFYTNLSSKSTKGGAAIIVRPVIMD